MKIPLDSYSLRARFLPAVLVLAPAVAALAAWLPLESAAWKTLASLGALAGSAILLSHLARDLGQRKQQSLFARWGGAPSTRFLRHRDISLNAATRERYHSKLASSVPGIEMPSNRSERAKPEAADAVYASCADWLREKTRDHGRFQLLFEENVSYGFRRNLWAMKPAGVLLAALGLMGGMARVAMDQRMGANPTVESWIAIAVSCVLLVWWLLRIRDRWVADAANAYARALLGACEEL